MESNQTNHRTQRYRYVIQALAILLLVSLVCYSNTIYIMVDGVVTLGNGRRSSSENLQEMTRKKNPVETSGETTRADESGWNNISGIMNDDASEVSDSLPFKPNQVLQQYKKWHSITALEKDKDPDRRFAIVYYYCPKRAGNILHSMLTTVIFAIIHNRTILLHYDTDFSEPNTEDECNEVLERSSWIPRWDDWAERLALPQPVPIAMDRNVWQYDQQLRVVLFPQIPDVMEHHRQIFRHEWRDDPSHRKDYLTYIYDSGPDPRQRAASLYYYGSDFLLGMLFRAMFTIRIHPDRLFPNDVDNVFSVALHSRHTVVGDDGSFVSDEVKCLRRVLPESRTPETCVVYLMSDRPMTVNLLTEWLHEYNCTAMSTLPDREEKAHEILLQSQPITFKNEHGPNAGDGFIRDLDLASHARSGLIGDMGRSSFALLAELVTYDRRVDDWRRHQVMLPREHPLFARCTIPGRYGKGYNYGPGTPTFVASHHHKTMDPLLVLNEYQSIHSSEALATKLGSLDDRSFAIGYLPCPWGHSVDDLYAMANDLLRAMTSNRTLLWVSSPRTKCTGNCTVSSLLSLEKSCEDTGEWPIEIKSWLPSLKKWGPQLNLMNITVNEVEGLVTPHSDRNNYIVSENIVRFPYESGTIFPPPITYNTSSESISEPFDAVVDGGSGTTELYAEGIDFLYGMLLENVVQFSSLVRESSPREPPPDPLAVSIAMDVTTMREDGGDGKMVSTVDINPDSVLSCIQSILSVTTATTAIPGTIGTYQQPSCQVFLIRNSKGLPSDDDEEDAILRTVSSHCSVHVINQTDGILTSDHPVLSPGQSQWGEPFPWSNYYKELIFVTDRARSGWIGRESLSRLVSDSGSTTTDGTNQEINSTAVVGGADDDDSNPQQQQSKKNTNNNHHYRGGYSEDSRSRWIRQRIVLYKKLEEWKLGRIPPLRPDLQLCWL